MILNTVHLLKEIPKDILRGGSIDGATIGRELIYVLAPMAVPGHCITLLLNFILAWNKSVSTLNLSTSQAAPLTVFIASYFYPESVSPNDAPTALEFLKRAGTSTGGAIGQRHCRTDARNRHQAPAHLVLPHDGRQAAVQDAELLA